MADSKNLDDELEIECAGCGLSESQWSADNPNGFIGPNGERYCCEECAIGTLCSCIGSIDEYERGKMSWEA